MVRVSPLSWPAMAGGDKAARVPAASNEMEEAATIAPSRLTRQLPRLPARAKGGYIKSSQEQNAARRRPVTRRADRGVQIMPKGRSAYGRGKPRPYRQDQGLPVWPVAL